jgi:hypothetical protein
MDYIYSKPKTNCYSHVESRFFFFLKDVNMEGGLFRKRKEQEGEGRQERVVEGENNQSKLYACMPVSQ